MTSFIWHNGDIKPNSAPVFTATDRIRLGDGVFDTMLAIDGEPVHADRHLKRLAENANTLHIPLPCTAQTIEQAALTLLRKNALTKGRAALNIILSRGIAKRGLAIPEKQTPSLTITAAPAPMPEDFPPIHAIIAQSTRRNERSPLARIKSCNYGDNILALHEARTKGANEAIMLNTAGRVCCASSGNIIALIDGTYQTPPLEDGAMNGTTRAALIKQGKLVEQSLTPQDLENAQAIYITNSIRGISPITQLEGKTIPALPSINLD